MYNEKIYLTPQDILNKEFNKDTMGYRPQEVDRYLDMFIRYYTEFINIIKKLQTENAQLSSDNEKLKLEYMRLKNIVDSANSGTTTAASGAYNNVDLLKRISNLEKTVYGKEE